MTGLDPAGPLNYVLSNWIFNGVYLDGSQAVQTVIVYTDMTCYGHFYSGATVNIFVNCGVRIQPHCPKKHTPVKFFPFYYPVSRSIECFDRFSPLYTPEIGAEGDLFPSAYNCNDTKHNCTYLNIYFKFLIQ